MLKKITKSKFAVDFKVGGITKSFANRNGTINFKRVSKKGREVEDVVRHIMTDSCEFIDSHSFQGRLRSSRVSKINEKKSF